MLKRLRVGTRRSPLARIQTESVVARLSKAAPGVRFELVAIETSGDLNQAPGTSPDFTDAIDRALRDGEIDLSVHSAKDLAASLPADLRLAACPPRADVRDCLVAGPRISAARLPQGARIGSSSTRRRAQLLRWRRDLTIVEIRGNVGTRLGLVHSRAVDAVILAVAGLVRLGRASEIGRILPVTHFLPAPAQGALAVVVRSAEGATASLVGRISHPPTLACVVAERALAAALGGDCNVPLGALARARGKSLSLVGEVLSPDGRRAVRLRRTGPAGAAAALGAALGADLLRAGATDLLAARSP
jgi:hydroxymethylbilane synthase